MGHPACEKDDNGISKFSTGIYYGEKECYYFSTNIDKRNSLTIKFDSIKYVYSGSWDLDSGKGNYLMSNDSIEFIDECGRIALYSWDWILSGKSEYKLSDDLLILTRRQHNQLITCKLTKIREP